MAVEPRKSLFALALPTLIWFMLGCEHQAGPVASSSPVVTSNTAHAVPSPVDQWLGQWNGPEGTFLVLGKLGDKYVVNIHSLDGVDVYDGKVAGDHIEFLRSGKTESIYAGDGNQTGMKWLMGKKNCLVIRVGEGFCRD